MSSTAAAHPLGREADKPTQIPAPGWKEIALRVFQQFSKDRVLLVAAGTTFYMLLAMVPALTAFVSLYGLFADPGTVQEHIKFLQDFMPGGAQEVIGDQLNRLSQQPTTGLGFALAISLGIALWSTNAGMKALFEAMNVAYGEEEKRGFVKLNLISLAFTLGAIVLLLAIIGVVVVLPLILEAVGLGSAAELLVKIGSAVVLALAGLAGLSALYRWGPSRREAEWKWITPGAVVAIVIGMIGSLLFSWYVSNFGSYNETYGSLGAIIGFMTWLWIMVIFVITGAELNAEMEHQTRKDTTTGNEKPMGTRGAEMADTVAQGPDDVGDSKASDGSRGSAERPQSAGKDGGEAAGAAGSRSKPSQPTPDRHRTAIGNHHGGAAGSRVRVYSGSGTRQQAQEPIGVVGGLLLLGAVALAVAAGNSGKKSPRGPRPGAA